MPVIRERLRTRFLDNAKGISMSDCCCPNTPAKNKQLCPECGVICKGVAMPTLYHQVRFPENQILILTVIIFARLKPVPLVISQVPVM